MKRLYASAKVVGLLLLGCAPDPIAGPEITILAHQLDQCRLPNEEAFLDLSALGDFDASAHTNDLVTSKQPGASLAFPPKTLAVSAMASFNRSSQRFFGISYYDTGPTLPLLFWPTARECPLGEDPTYPALGGGQALGVSRQRSLVLLVGSDAGESSAVSEALVFDARTGKARLLGANAQLWRPRAFASATEFGPGFLVAGGEDPTTSFSTGRRLHDTAEVYVAETDLFDPTLLIQLQAPRSRHAAVALGPSETLLIGGITASETGELQATARLELVDYTAGSTRHVGLLSTPRIAPRALLLDDGSIFVAGGHDMNGNPIAGAEWIVGNAVDGFETTPLEDPAFRARIDQAFVGMPGGSVLAVGGCDVNASSAGDCDGCRAGCAPQDGWDAFWIDHEHEVTALELDVAAPRPTLLAAPDGAPYLVVETPDSTASGSAALERFDPWKQAFYGAGRLARPPELDRPLESLDPGALVWVSEDANAATLVGRRFSTRDEFAQDLELISQVSGTNARWPLHLAPGQAAHDSTYARLVPRVEGSAQDFVLEMSGRASVWITDARFLDFWFEVTLDAGAPPVLLVDTPANRCRFANPPSKRPLTLRAQRRGSELTLEAEGSKTSCELPLTRVALGLRAHDDPTQLSKLSVRRQEP